MKLSPNIHLLHLKVKWKLIHLLDLVMSNVSGAKELDILLLNVQIKKTMILLDNGEIESESSSDDEIPPLEDCSDVDVTEPINEDVLVTGRALNMQLR